MLPTRPVLSGARKLTTNFDFDEPRAGFTVIGTEPLLLVADPLANAGITVASSSVEPTAASRLIPLNYRSRGRLAQLGERRLDKAEVAGSSPASPTSD